MIVGVGACGEGAAGEAGRRVSGWICWSCRRGSLFSRRVNGVRVGERRRGFGPAAADSFSRNGVFRSLLRAGAARNMPISEKQLQANRAMGRNSPPVRSRRRAKPASPPTGCCLRDELLASLIADVAPASARRSSPKIPLAVQTRWPFTQPRRINHQHNTNTTGAAARVRR